MFCLERAINRRKKNNTGKAKNVTLGKRQTNQNTEHIFKGTVTFSQRNVVVVDLYTLPANRYVHAASKKLQIRTATWCLLYGILEPSGMGLVQDN